MLGEYYRAGKQVFKVIVGREYLVYGMFFQAGVPWVQLLEEFGYIYPVPLCLFEIVDGRVSKYWKVRYDEKGVTLWPPSFSREFYLDDLIEGKREILEDFQRVREMIEQEANSVIS